MKSDKNSWNLGLLYRNEKDPQIEKDAQFIEKAFGNFEKKYKGKDFISSPKKLLPALNDFRELEKVLNNHKPWWYFALRKDLNAQDEYAQAKATQYNQRLTMAANKIAFFRLKLGKIPESRQKEFLKNSRLAGYSYLLKITFDKAKYNLTEEEEQLTGLLSQPGYTMWVSGQNKLLSSQTIKYKDKKLPIAEAVSILSEKPKKERYFIHQE
ncbi:MAG: hypothetical protein Q7S54_00740, partial [bacterium]|nr:hypothetical protein [bacterium]